MKPTVLAYYFPNWHSDPRTSAWFGEGWTEWALVGSAEPRFAGHRQPRVSALGEFDEADPAVFDVQIDLAVEHGVDGFIFDYYWYQDGPFLQRALDEGFLRASRREEAVFSLMWANHNLVDIFPARAGDGSARLLADGRVDRSAFEEMVRHITAEYFSRPNYLRVENRPWLSIYDLDTLVDGLGGVEATKQALDWFDEHVRSHGFDGVHLDGVVLGENELPGGIAAVADRAVLLERLGFRSASSYVWIHHAAADAVGFPVADWDQVRELAFESYERQAARLTVPFHPNVTVGWDSSPRTSPESPFALGAYPWIPTADPTAEQFGQGLQQALDFLDRHRPPHPIITVNAWNEWTEGSALLPDTYRGTAYLESLRAVLDAAGDLRADRTVA